MNENDFCIEMKRIWREFIQDKMNGTDDSYINSLYYSYYETGMLETEYNTMMDLFFNFLQNGGCTLLRKLHYDIDQFQSVINDYRIEVLRKKVVSTASMSLALKVISVIFEREILFGGGSEKFVVEDSNIVCACILPNIIYYSTKYYGVFGYDMTECSSTKIGDTPLKNLCHMNSKLYGTNMGNLYELNTSSGRYSCLVKDDVKTSSLYEGTLWYYAHDDGLYSYKINTKQKECKIDTKTQSVSPHFSKTSTDLLINMSGFVYSLGNGNPQRIKGFDYKMGDYPAYIDEYHTYGIRSNRIYRCDINGDEKSFLTDDDVESFIVYNGIIFYINKEHELLRMSSGGEEKTSVSKDVKGIISVANEKIYYLKKDGIYCSNIVSEVL